MTAFLWHICGNDTSLYENLYIFLLIKCSIIVRFLSSTVCLFDLCKLNISIWCHSFCTLCCSVWCHSFYMLCPRLIISCKLMSLWIIFFPSTLFIFNFQVNGSKFQIDYSLVSTEIYCMLVPGCIAIELRNALCNQDNAKWIEL